MASRHWRRRRRHGYSDFSRDAPRLRSGWIFQQRVSELRVVNHDVHFFETVASALAIEIERAVFSPAIARKLEHGLLHSLIVKMGVEARVCKFVPNITESVEVAFECGR